MTKEPLAPSTRVTAPFTPWPFYAEDEIEAVARVLRSGKVNYWTGQEGHHFEEEYAIAAGCKYAVALANGTVALDAIWKAIDIRPADEVIVTPRTFVACASSIVAAGAIPAQSLLVMGATGDTMRPQSRPLAQAVRLPGGSS